VRVVVLGGYGVFGARLAELLRRDGHAVWLAGRNLAKAEAAARRIGAAAAAVDRTGDLAPLFQPRPDVVIDAAGPFQAYGDDPYRLPRRCIAEGADYLDLADDAAFVAGIGALDEAARQAGRRVLSGASSTPGLSSIVVAALSGDMTEILSIETAILPGNQAPRGAAVIRSIVGQVGGLYPVWRGGRWRRQRCWSDKRRYRLAPDLVRSAYAIETPDNRLFPAAFGARSVMFRAGMELGSMNAALALLAALRRVAPLEPTPARVRLIQRAADLLLPFGTDRGGMRVGVVGVVAGVARRRDWTLVAEAGEGPFVPGVVCRALLRRFDGAAPGARACLAEARLAEIEAAMSDLAIRTDIEEAASPSLFQDALGGRWADLPPEVRALHDVHDIDSFSGVADVRRGASWLARAVCRIFRFPAAGAGIPLVVTKRRTARGETWERRFADQVFRSRIRPAATPGRVQERFGPFAFELDLPVEAGRMRLPVRRGWLFGLPIPRPLLPRSESEEYAADGRFHFDVALHAPFGAGLIVRYRGRLAPDRARPPAADDTPSGC